MCWYGVTTKNQRGMRVTEVTAIPTAFATAMIDMFLQSAVLLATSVLLTAGIMHLLIKFDDRKKR